MASDRCFVDTSALYALLDKDDSTHKRVTTTWNQLIDSDATLVTTNYVLLETFALAQNRLGIESVRATQQDLLPLLSVEWVDAELHGLSVIALLTAGRTKLSLVDCVSFETMRRRSIKTAFTVDKHFAEQGFRIVPEK